MTVQSDSTEFAADIRRVGTRVVTIGISAILLMLVIGGVILFLTLPDAGVFNERVERIFVENDTLTGDAEIKLLEILAQSGTAFAEVLSGYRIVIFVLLVFSTALLVAALVFLVILITLNRRMAQIERSGIQVSSLIISREEGENSFLEGYRYQFTSITTVSCPGPLALVDGQFGSDAELEQAAAIVARYSKGRVEEAVTLEVRSPDGVAREITVAPAQPDAVLPSWNVG